MKYPFKDLSDFLTKTVFETDYEDTRVSLVTKLGRETHIFIILGSQYVKVGLITASSGHNPQFLIEQSTVLQENTITEPKLLLDWALKHPKFKAIEDSQRIRRYLVGFYGDTMNAHPLSHTKETPLVAEGSLVSHETISSSLTHQLTFNQAAFLKTIPDAPEDASLHYGFLPIPVINQYLLCGERAETIQMLMDTIQPRGIIARIAYMPVNLMREALLDQMLEGYQRGLCYIYTNRTLIALGWSKQDVGGFTFMRSQRIPEDKSYRATVKDSLLGRAIIDITSAWQKACRIKSVENMSLYYLELPSPMEMTLERALHELFTQAKGSLKALELTHLRQSAQNPNDIPAEVDTLSLVTP